MIDILFSLLCDAYTVGLDHFHVSALLWLFWLIITNNIISEAIILHHCCRLNWNVMMTSFPTQGRIFNYSCSFRFIRATTTTNKSLNCSNFFMRIIYFIVKNCTEKWMDYFKWFIYNHFHFSYAAFGFGKRNCPAEQFARSRIFLVITSLLQKFKFCLPENSDVPPSDPRQYVDGVVLHPEKFLCRVIPRTRIWFL